MIPEDVPYEATLAKRREEISTICVHAGEPKDASTGALDVPIVMSSAFGFASASEAAGAFRGENDAYIYGRWENPTVRALERKIAALEGADDACATASGMAAVTGAVMSLARAGDHVVAPRSMYAEAARLLRERLPAFGVTTTFVASTTDDYAAAIARGAKVVYLETPQNPTLGVLDVAAIAAVARAHGAAVIVDGTFATPFCQSPIALGADLVVHSMTKAMSGHGDVIAGAIAGRKDLVAAARDLVVKGIGAALAPLSAWLVLRGLRTFALRQEHACRTAFGIAKVLSEDTRIAKVHHPSLASHPGHTIARRAMHAYGALLSFELAGGDTVRRGALFLESLSTVTHAVSLGDTRTLVVHPASTTHSTMPEETRRQAGIADGLLRISVGLESLDDLVSDLRFALAASEKQT